MTAEIGSFGWRSADEADEEKNQLAHNIHVQHFFNIIRRDFIAIGYKSRVYQRSESLYDDRLYALSKSVLSSRNYAGQIPL